VVSLTFALSIIMWNYIAHDLGLLTGLILGLATSPDFLLIWYGIYRLTNLPKFARHAIGIAVGLIVHSIVIEILNYYLIF
jgi:riboflavin transporter FmnP